MRWRTEEGPGRCRLDLLARIHHRNAIADLVRGAEVSLRLSIEVTQDADGHAFVHAARSQTDGTEHLMVGRQSLGEGARIDAILYQQGCEDETPGR